MPTYQYECAQCGHGFEVLQSMKDEKLKKCPQCGKNKLQRLIGSGSGIIFKGSGFYATDYKTKSPGKSRDESFSKPAAPAHCHSGSCGCGPKPTPP